MRMIEENDSEFKSVILEGVLEDYSQWFSDIAVSMAYIETSSLPEGFALPLSFREWVSKNQNSTEVNPSALKSLSNAHYAMRVASESIIASLLEGRRPDYKAFVEFKDLYNLFLKTDLDREMERLSRSGNPFVLSCVRVDSFSELSDQDAAFHIVKDNIVKSMRPFDDIYYLGDGEFLLSLKHTDVVGGEVALVRIQRSLDIDEDNTAKFSVSCCLSEPVSGDEISTLIRNMKEDLYSHQDDSDLILKFLDISPLERFMSAQK